MFTRTTTTALDFAFPDVCNTVVGPATVPLPYPNMGYSTLAVPAQYSVYMDVMPAHNLLTTTTLSSGDTAGVAMGVASGMVMGPCYPTVGSVKTFIGGAPAYGMANVDMQNSTNMVGACLTPSQVTVMVLT